MLQLLEPKSSAGSILRLEEGQDGRARAVLWSDGIWTPVPWPPEVVAEVPDASEANVEVAGVPSEEWPPEVARNLRRGRPL